eukprot:jgi/Botrbrau1/10028/Bobra.0012s0115.1
MCWRTPHHAPWLPNALAPYPHVSTTQTQSFQVTSHTPASSQLAKSTHSGRNDETDLTHDGLSLHMFLCINGLVRKPLESVQHATPQVFEMKKLGRPWAVAWDA